MPDVQRETPESGGLALSTAGSYCEEGGSDQATLDIRNSSSVSWDHLKLEILIQFWEERGPNNKMVFPTHPVGIGTKGQNYLDLKEIMKMVFGSISEFVGWTL